MQGSISTNTAAVTSVETTSSAESVFGKTAASGKGKRGTLPLFAEILAGQSGGSGKERDVENVLGKAEPNRSEKDLSENGSQVETSVAALRLPELIYAKTELRPQPMTLAVLSPGKSSSPETTVGKRDKKSDSKGTSNTSAPHQVLKSTHTSLSDSSTPIHVSPLLIPIVQPSNSGQLSLSPSKSVVATGVSPPPISSTTVQIEKDKVEADIFDAGVSESTATASATAPISLERDRLISNSLGMENSTAQSAPHESSTIVPGNISPLPDHPENGVHSDVVAGIITDGRFPAIANEQIAALQAVTAKPKAQQKAEPIQAHGVAGTPSVMQAAVNANVANTSGMHINAPVVAGATVETGTQYSTENKAQAIVTGNPFQHLDSGEPSATLLHANAHEVAVGVHDPSLGWVEIQAQSAAGHVSASLTTVTSEAHTSLAAEVPAITQYLADRNVNIHSLDIGTQGGGEGGGQQQSSSGYAEQEKYSQNRIASSGTTRPVQGAIEDVSAMETARTSSHISVRA